VNLYLSLEACLSLACHNWESWIQPIEEDCLPEGLVTMMDFFFFYFAANHLEELPLAPPPQPVKLTEEELKALYEKEEATLRGLRIFLREICAKLARNRQ
jgi:hypothetical protein